MLGDRISKGGRAQHNTARLHLSPEEPGEVGGPGPPPHKKIRVPLSLPQPVKHLWAQEVLGRRQEASRQEWSPPSRAAQPQVCDKSPWGKSGLQVKENVLRKWKRWGAGRGQDWTARDTMPVHVSPAFNIYSHLFLVGVGVGWGKDLRSGVRRTYSSPSPAPKVTLPTPPNQRRSSTLPA